MKFNIVSRKQSKIIIPTSLQTAHLFCPIYKLLMFGELGGVMRSFLSGTDTREGGEPDNWGTFSWVSSKSTDAEAEVSGDPRRTSYNKPLQSSHKEMVKVHSLAL